MNRFDAVLIGVVAVSSIIGYSKGFVKEAFGIASVIISALAAYIYFKSGGSLLFLFQVFILVNIGLHVAFWVVKKLLKQGDAKLSLSCRIGGGAIGFFKGAVFVLIALAALRFFGAMITTAAYDINKYTQTSTLYKISRVFNWPPVKEAESLKENQGPFTLPPEAVNTLIKNDSVRAILEDEQLKEHIRQKDYRKILSNPKFLSLLNDQEFLKQAVALGLQQSRQSVRKNGSSREE
ncbi:MAG: CvpA family protein [Candidatus Omnitrophota bacterium]|nr:CvpA family protein [Candidatus Omnitrophota bacterium]